MSEYVGLIAQNPNQLAYVKRQLARHSGLDSVFTQGIAIVDRAVRQDPLNRALRELAGWTYFEAGQYRRALDTYRAIDRLESEQGRVLYQFALDVADAGAIEVSLEALNEILERYGDGPLAPLALFGMAEIEEREGIRLGERALDATGKRVPAVHFDEALKHYSNFLATYPNDPRFPDALQRVGNLQRTVFFDLNAAQTTLHEVSSRFAATNAAVVARFNLGQIALERGDLAEARLTFFRLANELEIGDIAERCRFEIAKIDYYRGQFETALAIVSALDANTSTDISNDAIALKLLLRENLGPDSLNAPLRAFARSELATRQRRPELALQILDSVQATYPTHALSDEILFGRAMAKRQLGQNEEAIALLLLLPEQYPGSYLEDTSLFMVAEIYERDLGNTIEALKTYNTFLLRFPASLRAPEVRMRIRYLRGDDI
jgi:tetratricopeptide (TPR) repeat protein